MSYGNERDVEVPAVVEFVKRRIPQSGRAAPNLLDVGGHGSHATYAPLIRPLIRRRRYEAIDIIFDPLTKTVVDEWYTADFMKWSVPLGRFDAVTCVSVIEHVGVKPWRSDTWKEERLLMFFSLLRAARHAVLVTAPFGHGFVTNEYQCVSPEELATWQTIAHLMGFEGTARYYLGDSPQYGPWKEVQHVEACRGVAGSPFCVMVLELLKP